MTTRTRTTLVALVGAVVVSVLPLGVAAAQEASPTPERARLTAALARAAGGEARLSAGRDGLLRAFGTSRQRPVPRAEGVPADAAPAAAARAFLDEYGPVFGVEDVAGQLTDGAASDLPGGGSAVRLQQVHRGVPVLGGALVVGLDDERRVLSTNGEVATGVTVDTSPAVTAQRAARTAVGVTARAQGLPERALTGTDPALAVYDPALLGAPGPAGSTLVWRSEVTDASGSVRELVLVDALRGTVALHFDQVAEAKTRYVCNRNNVVQADDRCLSPYTRSEGGAATGVPDVDLAYDYAGTTYDFFKSTFNRDSVDGRGMPLTSTVKHCSTAEDCPYANAYWNGVQMVYGDGYASADDVVGHELAHAVTEFTSGLFYYMQSGAINESMSDVFGELVDLTDGRGNDAAGVRWDMGEDLPIGAIRDLDDPTRFGDPDRVRSTLYYSGLEDGGGVHDNSGVNNKAAALMVDGGTFNGQTVGALGVDKTARVYYQAQQLLTSASDYNDLYEVLQQSCVVLTGTSGITAADCANVKKAVTATEMHLQPISAAVPEAAVCDIAGQQRQDLFADDLENTASGNWTKTTTSGFGWAYPASVNAYSGYDAKYATSGTNNFWGDDPDGTSNSYIARTAGVTVPTGKQTYLRFAHAYGFEAFGTEAYDGGALEYSVDDGSTWVGATSLPAVNGYTHTFVEALGGPGFSGASQGYRTSRFDLSSLAGKSVKLRFRVASDVMIGNDGWFVDDVAVYSCGTPTPGVAVSDTRVVEGAAGATAAAVFTVTRTSSAGTGTVRYATAGGTATSGTDFTAVPLSTLSFAAGETSKTVSVPVRGDALPEGHESFRLDLSAPSGLVVVDASGTGTITEDETGAPASLTVSDPVVTEPDSGVLGAAFVVTRSGPTTETVTFSWATAFGTATSADIVSVPTTSATIAAGATSVTLDVPVKGDTRDEANESFSVLLSNVQRAQVADGTGTGTIVDDEGTVTPGPATFYRVADLQVVEGAASTSAAAVVTVTRTGATGAAGSVGVSLGTGTATVGRDVAAFPATTLSFAAGQTFRTVSLSILGDTVPEAHETALVRLSAPSGGVLSDGSGTVTLTDTDTGTPASLSLGDVLVPEGGVGPASAVFTVRRTGDTSEAASVTWATAAAVAPLVPATAGKDYTARTPARVSFAAGQVSLTVSVPLLPDSVFEPAESFQVLLSSPVAVTLSDAAAVGTIVDDD